MQNKCPISSVIITPGCITCGVCEFIAPAIFQVTDISHVRKNALIALHISAIEEAARACPVQVIRYEK